MRSWSGNSRREFVQGLLALPTLLTANSAAARDPAREMSLEARMFSRRLVTELPHTPSPVQATIGRSVYPQSFAVNSDDKEIYVLHNFTTDEQKAAIFCAYDMRTAKLKTWFFSKTRWRETLVYKSIAERRWLYTIGEDAPIRYDITQLPAPGSVIAPEREYNSQITPYSQMTSVDDGFAYMVQDKQFSDWRTAKHRWVVVDNEFNPIRRLDFSPQVTGSYGRTLLSLPKTQGVAWHRGMFVFGCGGAYRPEARGSSSDASLPAKQQGLIAATGSGQLLSSALCAPDVALQLTGKMIGREIGVHECEGVSSGRDGNLYAIWQVQKPSQWKTEGKNWGIVITEEMYGGDNAFDYSKGALR